MNVSAVPQEFRWLAPIIMKLNQQLSDEGDAHLSQSEVQQFKTRFSSETRAALENWIDLGSPESEHFLIAITLLDGLGLLEDTEPTLDYAYWFSELNSENWGSRAGAAQEIADHWLETLSSDEFQELANALNTSSRVKENPNTKIWFSWLLCTMGVSQEANLKNIVHFLDEKFSTEDSFDELIDACFALLKLHAVPSNYYDRVQEIISWTSIEQSTAACILDSLLRSDHVPHPRKRKVYDEVSVAPTLSLNDEIQDVLKDFKKLSRKWQKK